MRLGIGLSVLFMMLAEVEIAISSNIIIRPEIVAESLPIIEIDLWELLKQRLLEASEMGLLQKANKANHIRLKNYAARPCSESIPVATKSRSWTKVLLSDKTIAQLDPALKNELSRFTRNYLFFDADDYRQKRWVMHFIQQTKFPLRLILTGGNVEEAQKLFNIRVFADQGKSLQRRFDIHFVPTLLKIDPKRAQLTEFVMDASTEVESDDIQ